MSKQTFQAIICYSLWNCDNSKGTRHLHLNVIAIGTMPHIGGTRFGRCENAFQMFIVNFVFHYQRR